MGNFNCVLKRYCSKEFRENVSLLNLDDIMRAGLNLLFFFLLFTVCASYTRHSRCKRVDCSTRAGKVLCPHTCKSTRRGRSIVLNAPWCDGIDCTKNISWMMCPITCANSGIEEEITENTGADAEWCDVIDCSQDVAKKVCPNTCNGDVFAG